MAYFAIAALVDDFWFGVAELGIPGQFTQFLAGRFVVISMRVLTDLARGRKRASTVSWA